ncbi:MAG: beta strand repeat-containing protein, partial [Cytophagaceae bacterium]
MKKNTSYKSVYPTALKRFFSLIFIAVLTSLSGIAATINSSAGGGNWNSTASWTPAQIPVAGDVVIISGGNITITANAACADITINAGKTLTMNGGNSFDVSGNWVNNGTFSPACCGGVTTVTMTGAGKSIGGSSASTFYNLVINPGAGNTVSLATGNMNIMNGGTLTLQSGIFKPGSANTLTFMNGGNTTINASGGGNFANALNGYTDADGGTILMAGSSGNNLNLTSTAGNILQLNNIMTAGTSDGNWRLNTTVAGSVRINGALTIPLGGGSNQWAASGNPPIWGTASTFYINKNGQQYTPGMEWTASSGTIGVTPGYPNNVTLVNMGNSADNSFIVPGYGNIPVGWKATGAIGLNGTLRIGDGTTPGLASLANVTSFNCGGLIVDDNSRLIGPPTAASFTDRGNFTLQGSSAANTGLFFDAGATITFAGTGTIASPQIVSTTGTTGITFPSMVVNSPSSTYVRLDDPVTVSNTLTLTSGYVGTTNTNILTVGNTASTAITGGSATSYVDGPLAWSLPTTTAGNYKFPIGDGGAGGSYLPLTISSATSAGATVTATAFEANSNGIPDATISSISPTEYWSVSTTTPFTSALVSVSRPTAVAPYNALGESSSV